MRRVICIVALSMVVGCASTGAQQSLGEYLDDAATTKRVQVRLADDATVGGQGLGVEVVGGVAILRGRVTSSAQRSRAESLVLQVPGVRAVRNDVVVRP